MLSFLKSEIDVVGPADVEKAEDDKEDDEEGPEDDDDKSKASGKIGKSRLVATPGKEPPEILKFHRARRRRNS